MILPNSSLLNHSTKFHKTPVQFAAFPRCPSSRTAAFRAVSGGNWVGIEVGNRRMGLGIGCFGNWGKKKDKQKKKISEGREVEIEEFDEGVDVMDASMAESKVFPDHLVVMVHGLIGSAADWRFAADQFVKQLPDKVIVHCSHCNIAKLTFDGVDVMGERLADEVLTVVRNKRALQKISFVAHSLGGLVVRYAIGRLYEPVGKLDPLVANRSCLEADDSSCLEEKPEEDCKGRIAGLKPMNLITVATPHLGSRGHRQLPVLCGLAFLERQAKQTAHLVAGKTGKHLFLDEAADDDGDKPPLLVRMVSDSYELKFMSALSSFKRRAAYANVNYDPVVGWGTSSIRRWHELPRANLLVKDVKYPHIVHIEHPTLGDNQHEASLNIENQIIDYEEEMIRGLNQVSWERVDVSFHKSRQRYVAHNTIQVKSYWLNSDGTDVVFHIIDNFQV